MKRVSILVEGQTEETFVREVLQSHLQARSIYVTPILATTRRYRSKPSEKGGIVSYPKFKRDVLNLLNDRGAFITTMIDFYGLAGKGFPGWDTITGDYRAKVHQVEEAIRTDVGNPRFMPYLALHEFEAMLFAEPEKIVEWIGSDGQTNKIIHDIRAQFDSPEAINLDAPPSQRLIALSPSYDKVTMGVLIALEIGLETIRRECTHFDSWLKQLEILVE